MFSDPHKTHKYIFGQSVELHLKTQSVPHSKHSVSVTKTSQLVLFREIVAVCSEIHTKHVSTLCGQNVEFVNVKLVVLIVTNWASDS